ncbi:hypothetical protein Tco_0033074 [Tanacetum coccineum]
MGALSRSQQRLLWSLPFAAQQSRQGSGLWWLLSLAKYNGDDLLRSKFANDEESDGVEGSNHSWSLLLLKPDVSRLVRFIEDVEYGDDSYSLNCDDDSRVSQIDLHVVIPFILLAGFTGVSIPFVGKNWRHLKIYSSFFIATKAFAAWYHPRYRYRNLQLGTCISSFCNPETPKAIVIKVASQLVL